MFDPQQVQRILDQANDLLEAGRSNEVLDCLDPLADAHLDEGELVEYVSLRAWALGDLGRYDEALAILGEALESVGGSPRVLTTLGVVLSNQGDLERACDALEEAHSLDDQDEIAIANLGLVYEKLRDFEQALEFYHEALDLGFDLTWLLQRIAAVHAELGDLDEAKATLKRYLSLVPDDGEQWISLGVLYSEDEDFDRALRCFEAATHADPDWPSLRMNWGVTAIYAGKLDLAREQLEQLRELEPGGTRAAVLNALLLERMGDAAAAREAYVDALRGEFPSNYDDACFAFELAMEFFARERDRDACDSMLKAAYRANVCTVEVCETYRELTGQRIKRGMWYSLMVEADYRDGLSEVLRVGPESGEPRRYRRNVQVIARDHDEALDIVTRLFAQMGESNLAIREFANEEPIKDTYSGVYEIERDATVVSEARVE